MLKNVNHVEKFAMIKEWLPQLFEAVKKELKNEHLRQDPQFLKKYFAGKNFNKITNEELIDGYTKAIGSSDKAEEIAEFITNRWIMKHADIYNYFEEQLTKINPNFAELEELTKEQSHAIIENSVSEFGATQTYLFAVLNSVVFPNDAYQQLNQRAKQEASQKVEDEKNHKEKETLESLQQNFDREIAKLSDKYEKKLAGMQKKYNQDTEALKKQVASLQRKLNPLAGS